MALPVGYRTEQRTLCAGTAGAGRDVSRSTIGARVMTGDEGVIERCRTGVAGGSGADGCPYGASTRGWRPEGSSACGSQGRSKALFSPTY
jgi:hypothetical protein